MKTAIFLVFISFSLRAQQICIPLAVGDSLEHDVQRMYAFKDLANIRGERIIVLEKENKKKDLMIFNCNQQIAALDSIAGLKDKVIDKKDEIISYRTKGKVKWYWIPVMLVSGYLIGK